MTAPLIAIAATPERQALLDSALATWCETLGRGSTGRRVVVAWLPDELPRLRQLTQRMRASVRQPVPRHASSGDDDFAARLLAALPAELPAELPVELPVGSERDSRRDAGPVAPRDASTDAPVDAPDDAPVDEPAKWPTVVLIGSACAYEHTARDRMEMSLVDSLRDGAAAVRLLRVGDVLSAKFGLPRRFARRVAWRSLAVSQRQDCFPTAAELIAAVSTLFSGDGSWFREQALLGRRRTASEALEEYVREAAAGGTSLPEWALSRGLGRLSRLFRAGPTVAGAKTAHVPLQPADTRQLLALCGTVNRPHVALAGFNTGVNHFGWRYPGKTLVQTLKTGKRIRVRGSILEADAGVLIKDAIAALRHAGCEFLVLPNYSYVSLGTVFMVPVHGSGCEVSTLGETIVKALVYDPATDRIVRVRRGDSQFDRWMYNPESGVVVLRLWFRVRPRFRYFRQQRTLAAPSAAELWNAFRDPDASHIEARKQRAADRHVSLYRYRLDADGLGGQAEELPRDTIGRVWDRIERNRIAATLFHAFVRNFGFHVELFLNEAEFARFWEHHRGLPLAKMQFRLARRDGLTHSPCGDCDRMSIDLFMSRRRSARFLAFVKEHLPHARFNRGKHSM